MRPSLVVAKIGSSTLSDEQGRLDRSFIAEFCNQVAALAQEGTRVVIVSSGAVAAGREAFGLTVRPSDVPTLQACASAGQSRLTQAYAEVLAQHGIACGQVLLTRRDVMDREVYLNARNTLERLLDLGAVPVVNENDTVSVTELSFGDNDMLGAIVAALVGADLYVICSDVEGLYTANPAADPTAKLIERVDKINSDLMSCAGGAGTSLGTGGMVSKLRAARAMMAAGIPTVICRGRRPDVLQAICTGSSVGTRFENPEPALHDAGRRLWIGLAEVARGSVTIDAGALSALQSRGASVLPVGIVSCEGSFAAGDVIAVKSMAGDVVARGVCRYSSDDISRVHGLRLDVVARFLGEDRAQPALHRDELLVL